MGADLIATRIIGLADRKATDWLEFSDEGWRELTDFHDMVLKNIQHGISVLVSEDVGLARDLVEQKETLRRTVQDLERRHIERLSQGMAPSIETSAIHLSLLRALKSLNSSFAMTAYSQLSGAGELLQSRLAVQSRQA
ncbi:PhoU domain-containing protein [Sulfitobacter sp. 20_GPM-1509m]|uniref:PhoU domain-containing protein n=1 Tax=Sulfitobacter sp. 20_GPM-1509m TaxID=1380367 RepID=UPI000AADD2BC|nr:PhoU domain-containing protein [Sulfitobacter sp. 20_GPM-1509m]